jgi:hypothetical protein
MHGNQAVVFDGNPYKICGLVSSFHFDCSLKSTTIKHFTKESLILGLGQKFQIFNRLRILRRHVTVRSVQMLTLAYNSHLTSL